ncbi:MAG: TlyA family RNA methyltransferase [Candidatus Aminicenantes bacterium]|nr:MAG: TlyA family RNA methyltransferase [Candidatus Aminicenantes bacterium]
MKERADKVVFSKGLAESRQRAQALIMAGLVYSEGKRIDKPGQKIAIDKEISLKERMSYVSRGGLKLEEAIEAFEISIPDKIAADLGASTGGFTDCLLQKGAKRVYAVDVDTRQIDYGLRNDPRVVLVEKNARYLKKDDFEDELDIITTDLAFISVLKVLPAIKELLGKGRLLSLLKPQFEVGKGQVGKKGIVKDPSMHEDVLNHIIAKAHEKGFKLRGLIQTSVRGQKGIREFFVWWSLAEGLLNAAQVQSLIKEAVWNEKN